MSAVYLFASWRRPNPRLRACIWIVVDTYICIEGYLYNYLFFLHMFKVDLLSVWPSPMSSRRSSGAAVAHGKCSPDTAFWVVPGCMSRCPVPADLDWQHIRGQPSTVWALFILDKLNLFWNAPPLRLILPGYGAGQRTRWHQCAIWGFKWNYRYMAFPNQAFAFRGLNKIDREFECECIQMYKIK